MNKSQGIIYVLVNPSLSGLLKVGFTTRTIEERVKELSSSTSIPTPFIAIYWRSVGDVENLEKIVHARLKSYGFSHGKEYFKAAPPIVIDLIISLSAKERHENSEHIDEDERSLEELALDYFNGKNGLLRNKNKAIELLDSAIALGSTSALWKSACLSLNSIKSTKKERSSAYDKLFISAEANQTTAYFCIALIYCAIPEEADIYFKAMRQYFESTNTSVLDEIISSIENHLFELPSLRPSVGNNNDLLASPKNRNELLIYSILHFIQTHQLWEELCFEKDLGSIRNSISHLKPVLIRELKKSKYEAFWTESEWIEENLN